MSEKGLLTEAQTNAEKTVQKFVESVVSTGYTVTVTNTK